MKYMITTWNKEVIYREQGDRLSEQRTAATGVSSSPRGQEHSNHGENVWDTKGSESQGGRRFESVAIFLENPGPIPSTHMRAHDQALPLALGDPMPFPAHHTHCWCPDIPAGKTSIKQGIVKLKN